MACRAGAGVSYSSLGYTAWEAGPTLPNISCLFAVCKLSHSLVRNLLSSSPLSACGSGSLVSRLGGAARRHIEARRVDPWGTLGQVTLGIRPLVVVSSDINQTCARQLNMILDSIWDDGTGVVRG